MSFSDFLTQRKPDKHPPKHRESPEERGLKLNLAETKQELEDLQNSLNFITDPILMNQIIFQLKAAEVRYQYWYCMARDLHCEPYLKSILPTETPEQ